MKIKIKNPSKNKLSKPLNSDRERSDVQGSYTGNPSREFGEVPTQDQDDL